LDSDPAIRWQVLRDLADAPPELLAAERALIPTHGWGAQLLATQRPDGSWGGDEPADRWRFNLYTLHQLRAFGPDPDDERVRAAIERTGDRVTWGPEFGDSPFFEGETEPCINGQTLAIGAYFGQPSERLVTRLLAEQLDDGGWNCEAPEGSSVSSFHSTICVLEGLAEYERAGGPQADVVAEATARGEEYLLQRRLFRSLRTGEVIDRRWTRFGFPHRWRYDVLRGVDYFYVRGGEPDPRLADAFDLLQQRQHQNGRWPLTNRRITHLHFAMDPGDGQASRWVTFRALRALRWANRV
jgi:hypothetical protein